MLLGHLALPTLLKHYLDVEPFPVYAGSLFPDVLDKALYVGELTENGRSTAHTLLGLAVSTLMVGLLGGRGRARAWSLGYLGHLLCDMGGHVPWLSPFKTYAFVSRRESLWRKLARAFLQVGLLEAGLIFWAALLTLRWLRNG